MFSCTIKRQLSPHCSYQCFTNELILSTTDKYQTSSMMNNVLLCQIKGIFRIIIILLLKKFFIHLSLLIFPETLKQFKRTNLKKKIFSATNSSAFSLIAGPENTMENNYRKYYKGHNFTDHPWSLLRTLVPKVHKNMNNSSTEIKPDKLKE